MAATLSQFQVFQDQTHTAKTEVESQMSEVFNQASAGAISLRNEPKMGDFYEESYYGKISNLVGVRDVYTDSAVTAEDISTQKDVSVKFGMSTKPIKIDPSALTWIQASPAEAATVYGQQLAVGSMKEKVNVAIGALASALAGQSDLLNDQKAEKDDTAKAAKIVSIGHLLDTAAKLGDRYASIVLWVMHSEAYFTFLKKNVTTATSAQLFSYDNMQVMEFMGRRILVTDDPALKFINGTGANKALRNYRALGLVQDACIIRDQGDFLTNIDTSNGRTNIHRTYQSEWSAMIGLKGFTWDISNGGKSPTATELKTGTNWDKSATDIKDMAGVCLQHPIDE